MLGRFSTALQQAAEVLAPAPPLFEDFVYYWKKLMNHYLDVSKTKSVPIELTNIPNHLEHLLQILLKEEQNTEGVGPCLEYLLQHNLLDLMVTLASTDDPPGMKQHVLQFVAKLLSQSKTIVVAHLSIYFALQKLVGLCDGSTPTATESFEIQFLLSFSGVLRKNPQLISVFLTNSSTESSSTGRRTSSSSTGSEASSSPKNALFTTPLVPSARSCGVTLVPQPMAALPPASSSQPDSHPMFPLADAIFSYLDSPDVGVRLKACQSVMLLVSLPEETRTAVLISSEASLRLISRLVLLYYTIPHSTDPNHVDDMHLSWGLDIPTNDCIGCEGCKQAATFLSWFDFCDQVMVEANNVIAEALTRRLSESFLGQVFSLATLQKPITLTILTKCFKMASSVYMNAVLFDWCISDSISNILINNWSSQDSDLSIETLRFFELILEKGSDEVLYNLVLKFIFERNYLDSMANNEGMDFSEDSEEQAPKNNSAELKPEQDSKINSPELKPEIHTIIKKWTNLVPQEVQSCLCGYEEYIGESMRQYQATLSKLSSVPILPHPPVQTTTFNEGPFLSALLSSLSKIPKQSYELNLELTGIVSRLALRPEPQLTEYLLDTTVKIQGRSLYTVLSSVASELGSCISGLPLYKQTLTDVRATLLGRATACLQLKNDPWIERFESVVVIEELCKELAAIAHVKLKSNTT